MRLAALSTAVAFSLMASAALADAPPNNATSPGAPSANAPAYALPPWFHPPNTLPYDPGDPIPAGYIHKTRAHRGLIVAGAVTFSTSYLLSAIVAGSVVGGNSSERTSFTPLFVPCVGPFIATGTVQASAVGQFWLTLDGVTQSAGMAMFITGLLVDQHFLKRALTPPTASLRPEVAIGPGMTKLTWQF